MRRARPRFLAATLLAGALVAWIAMGGLPGGIGGLQFASAATAATYSCEAVPAAASPSTAASANPSPSSSPGSLCISVQDVQSSVGTGDTAYWAVQVWAQGAAPSASVWLNVDDGLTASFSSSCPGGNGAASCNVGDLGIGSAPSMYQMQAQVPIPSSANLNSLTLTATAYAATTPAMSADPQAAQTMTVIAPAPSVSPTPAASATSSSASPSATPASSASSAGTSSSSTAPAQSSTSAGSSTGAPGTALPVLPPGVAPSLGAMPTASVGPASELLVPSGTVANMLPLIAPSPSGAPGSSPAADAQALPVTTSDSANSDGLVLGMSASAAQDIGLVFLVLALLFAGTRIARKQPAAVAKADGNQPAQGKRSGPGTARWSRFVIPRDFHLPRRTRRNGGDVNGGDVEEPGSAPTDG
jgi:hypothetical protein